MRIGIDLGGTKIEAIALSPAGQEIARLRVTTPRDYVVSLDAIVALVLEVERAAGAQGPVGVGIPGTAGTRTGLGKNANSTWLNGHLLKLVTGVRARPRTAHRCPPVRPGDRGRRGERRRGRRSDPGPIPRSAEPRHRIADQRAGPGCGRARRRHVEHRGAAGSDVRAAATPRVCCRCELRSGRYPRGARRARCFERRARGGVAVARERVSSFIICLTPLPPRPPATPFPRGSSTRQPPSRTAAPPASAPAAPASASSPRTRGAAPPGSRPADSPSPRAVRESGNPPRPRYTRARTRGPWSNAA